MSVPWPAVVSAALAALAAALLVPGSANAPRAAGRAGLRRDPVGSRLVPVLLLPGVVLMVAVADGLRLVLGLVLLAAAAGAVRLVERTRAARAADRVQERVVEVCEAMAGELRAGEPLLTALERSAEVWPDLGVVVAAARLDADVPSALRRLAGRRGAAALADVAAAWQVAEGSGAGLAAALGEVATSARDAQATRRLVRAELASAQATARLVAGLPVLSLLLAVGVGADPWHFLLDTPAGIGCLAAGLALAHAGLAWIDRIAAHVLER